MQKGRDVKRPGKMMRNPIGHIFREAFHTCLRFILYSTTYACSAKQLKPPGLWTDLSGGMRLSKNSPHVEGER
jgi:hypothetical protein